MGKRHYPLKDRPAGHSEERSAKRQKHNDNRAGRRKKNKSSSTTAYPESARAETTPNDGYVDHKPSQSIRIPEPPAGLTSAARKRWRNNARRKYSRQQEAQRASDQAPGLNATIPSVVANGVSQDEIPATTRLLGTTFLLRRPTKDWGWQATSPLQVVQSSSKHVNRSISGQELSVQLGSPPRSGLRKSLVATASAHSEHDSGVRKLADSGSELTSDARNGSAQRAATARSLSKDTSAISASSGLREQNKQATVLSHPANRARNSGRQNLHPQKINSIPLFSSSGDVKENRARFWQFAKGLRGGDSDDSDEGSESESDEEIAPRAGQGVGSISQSFTAQLQLIQDRDEEPQETPLASGKRDSDGNDQIVAGAAQERSDDSDQGSGSEPDEGSRQDHIPEDDISQHRDLDEPVGIIDAIHHNAVATGGEADVESNADIGDEMDQEIDSPLGVDDLVDDNGAIEVADHEGDLESDAESDEDSDHEGGLDSHTHKDDDDDPTEQAKSPKDAHSKSRSPLASADGAAARLASSMSIDDGDTPITSSNSISSRAASEVVVVQKVSKPFTKKLAAPAASLSTKERPRASSESQQDSTGITSYGTSNAGGWPANVGIKRTSLSQETSGSISGRGRVESSGTAGTSKDPTPEQQPRRSASEDGFHRQLENADNADDFLQDVVNEITESMLSSTRPLPASKLNDNPDSPLDDADKGQLVTNDNSDRDLKPLHREMGAAGPKGLPLDDNAPPTIVVYRLEDGSLAPSTGVAIPRQDAGSSELITDRHFNHADITRSIPTVPSSSGSLSDLSRTPTPPNQLQQQDLRQDAEDSQAAAAQTQLLPDTIKKKRKMTGTTSKHFSPPKRSRQNASSSLIPKDTGEAAVAPPQRPTATASSEDVPGQVIEQVEVVNKDVLVVPPADTAQILTPSKQLPQKTTDAADEATSPRKTVSVRAKRKATPKASPHFTPFGKMSKELRDRVDQPSPSCTGTPRRRVKGVSNALVPSINEANFGLIQERLWNDPFWLLIAVTFLNRTTGRAAVPIFWDLKEKYPTPEALADADEKHLRDMIECLGLHNQRSKRLVLMAKIWLERPPAKCVRPRTLHYPAKGDGSTYKRSQIIEEDAEVCAGALEIGHIPGCGAYAYDSWRIFCRDVLRGVAEDYRGTGAEDDFEPEWQRVLPLDKELRACLRWMWLRKGSIWDPLTGEKRRATEDEMKKAVEGEMEIEDSQERKFAAQAAAHESTGDVQRSTAAAEEEVGDEEDEAPPPSPTFVQPVEQSTPQTADGSQRPQSPDLETTQFFAPQQGEPAVSEPAATITAEEDSDNIVVISRKITAREPPQQKARKRHSTGSTKSAIRKQSKDTRRRSSGL